MLSLLFLGFVIGMRHALEADHFAAVASLTSQGLSARNAVRHGAAWGLGHTITLFLFGLCVLLVDQLIPQQLAHGLEMVVGVMLIVLGIDVVWRAARARIHYHLHKHDGRQSHFHAHSHVGDGIHKESRHNHEHIDKFPMRALFVGLIHGMAGSAALIILTLESVKSFWLGLAYIALFGIGSILGMAVLSTIISIPLNSCSKKLTWLHNSLQILIGVVTLGIGSAVLMRLY